MYDWKKRLYDHYVSSGQAGININRQTGLNIGNYPYFSKLIKEHLPDKKDIRILDLACGHGALIYCLKQLGYSNLEGIDISPEQVELAHELGLAEIQCRDMQDYLTDKAATYDVIFLMDILEHLSKVELFDVLDQVSKALRINGIAVIHVPNAEGIFGMRILYGDLTHENCFTPRSMRQVLNACGFQNIECFEDKPVIHGPKGLVRYVLWVLLMAPFRLMLAAEIGASKPVFSQNMLVIARKVG
ncbi:MAG: class I SAM-dependent methyltransferase [bacterium]|nr:class I SAM-dependent methyltransferase [bacterium]